MFYELEDYDYDTGEKDVALINLDTVLTIKRNFGTYQVRNDKTGQVTEWYRLKVYYMGQDNSWNFYYESESDRLLAYNSLKKALDENNLLIKNAQAAGGLDKIVDDIVNKVENDFHPLDDALKRPSMIDIPEVKY